MPAPLLAFAAHPDDLEFAVAPIIAKETAAGRPCHFILCSKGEASTHGTPDQRITEAQNAAQLLGATIEFLTLDGDAHLEIKTQHALTLAQKIREHKPAIILAPTLTQNQHPDHYRLGTLVRDAARLARYGGIEELKPLPRHAIDTLLYYALSPDAEPKNITPILIDISDPALITLWQKAMQCNASQMQTKNYLDFHLARARTNGLRAGVEYAIPLFPNDPLLFDSLDSLKKSARAF